MPETYAKPGTFKRFLVGAVVIVICAAAATSVAAWHELDKVVNAVTHTKHIPHIEDVVTQAQSGKPQTILLMGSDQRSKNAIDVRTGAYTESKPNSDTMILMRLDPSKRATALLSLPRDLKVLIPGHGYAKLNAAYSLGGARLTVRTIRLLDPRLKINHVINVDFHGFSKAVNALGCIYTDVDHHYFNQSDLYAKIDIHAGYQRLCGQDALSYVRYRHDDNDLVRATRQQDFLRDVKAQVGAFGLINDRDKLLHIFSSYTSSDLQSRSSVLRLLQLAVLSASHPVQEIHFRAKLGASYVYARKSVIAQVVSQFLGVPAANAPQPAQARRHRRHHVAAGLVDASGAMRDQALQAQSQGARLPVWYPSRVVSGSTPLGPPAVYSIVSHDGKHYPAYRIVIEKAGPAYYVYYGLQGTTFTKAPILSQPHTTQTVHGRKFNLYYDGSKLRMVSWQAGPAVYWISNTLLESLTNSQMLGLATSAQHL